MSTLTTKNRNTVLVSLMNNQKDFRILQEEGWYRIRKSKITPIIVKDKTIKYIAFYQTKIFEENAFKVEWYGDVVNVEEVSRIDLFPHEIENHPKAKNRYYKIQVKNLRKMPKNIFSQRPRRFLFIATTEEKFFGTMQLKYPEINYLHNDSPLENLLFQELIEARIFPERQYFLQHKKSKWILDFAIFCKTKNINIECDGLSYHYATIEQKKYDNVRNNNLTSEKWAVLRYNTTQIMQGMDKIMTEIKKTVDYYGGVENPLRPKEYYYVNTGNQMRLF